jgi:hypothetical protein
MTKIKLLLTTVLLLVAFGPVALAQTSKGAVVGTITDQSGAVISGATVKITNTATNSSRETTTAEQGTFRFDTVDPGVYTVNVSASGFRTTSLNEVPVAAGQVVTAPFKLEVGAVGGEVVEVTADASVQLQTQDGARTSTLDSRQIVDIPISTLNPVDLVFTLPGVVAPSTLAGGFVQGTEFSINGLRPRANNQLIDGTDNNDNSITGQFYQPTLRDGYSEVSILGANNSAEYGRAGGAVVNVITKSGSNQFHGSVYDVVQPSALFSLSSGGKLLNELNSVPVSIQNQYGFSFGGPVIKDKLFFFGTFQANPFRAGGVTATAIVPTADGFNMLRQLFPAGRSANLDRYLSIVGDLRGTAAIRPIALGGGRPSVNFGVATATSSQPVDDYQFLTRIDYNLSSKDTITGRYLFDDQLFANQFPSAFKGFSVDVPSRIQNFYFNYTRIISPKVTNEFRFAYGRFNVIFAPAEAAALNGPQIAVTGITAFGLTATFPQGRIFNNYQYQDTITYQFGNHTIRAGADIVRQLAKQFVPFNSRGLLTFTANPAVNNGPAAFPAFGNFVDGFSGTAGTFATKVFGNPRTFPNAFQQAYFVNDTWRVKPNLTLTYGLRYENYGTPFNVVPFPAFAGFDVPINTRVEQKGDNNNFSPRLSFAYTPRFAKFFGEDKTVIRGGFSITYDVFFNNILSNTAAASPNAFGATLLGSSAGGRGIPNAGVSTLPTTGAPNPLAGITTIDRSLVNPQTYVFNLGVQRELPGNLIAEVSYVGSRGTRLFVNEQLNPGLNNRRIDGRRGPITIRTNGGDSIYHSLQARLERGFRNGIFARFAYTYSKTIDNTSEVFTTTGGSSFNANPFNRALDRGVSTFDATQRAVLTFVWDLPGPKKGILGQAFGGYTVSGSYKLQSGGVETPYVGGIDLNRDLNAFNDRPGLSNPNAPRNSVAIANGDGTFSDANGDPINPANTFYIVDPAVNAFNAVGRDTLRGERINIFDMSVTKAFKMPFEGHRLELRLELFNAFNHANYGFEFGGNSDGDVLNPNFNNVRLNFGANGRTDGINRTGRIQIRYSF